MEKIDKDLQRHIKKLNQYEYNLLDTICKYSNITFDNLFNKRRKYAYVNARKVATYFLLRKGYKLKAVGGLISIIPKDHSTVTYLYKKASQHYKLEESFKNIVDSVESTLSTKPITSLQFKNK